MARGVTLSLAVIAALAACTSRPGATVLECDFRRMCQNSDGYHVSCNPGQDGSHGLLAHIPLASGEIDIFGDGVLHYRYSSNDDADIFSGREESGYPVSLIISKPDRVAVWHVAINHEGSVLTTMFSGQCDEVAA